MSSAVVVVWRPFCVSSLTDWTRSCKPGSTAFKSEDFPDAALAGNNAFAIRQPGTQSINAKPSGRGDEQDVVTELRIDANERHQIGRLDEIDLVDADDRPNLGTLGGHEQPVDQVRFDAWLCRARHDDQLVDVRDQHMLSTAAGAAHYAVAWFDALDDALFGPLGSEPHDVAGCDDVPLVGRECFQAGGEWRTG